MSTFIHASAIVHPDAAIGDDCHIGPFVFHRCRGQTRCGREARFARRDRRITTIGDGTHVYPFVSIGLGPQDLKYAGEATSTEIGLRMRYANL